MPWTLTINKRAMKKWDNLTALEQENWIAFQNAIARNGMSPAAAADILGRVGGKDRADYKKIGKNTDQFQIRLSKSHRATFRVIQNNNGGTVQVLEVGGHT